ncbi:heme lyase CcmF/NrfE family subunit [uncultured Aquabacterium sp.]|uniref:heme lyase CcmF/NrfE family subunit n=1 Tax=Aquabacterium sp. TaxID=1872578 RepID=UPI0025FCDA46|nr:heme lyase CcmF/NrfE family subunit [uncultured Aquabacterium sp.]
MTAELGQWALILALGVALLLGSVPLWGAHTGRAHWMALARPLAVAQFVLVGAAFGLLVAAFVQMDWSVAYVSQHANGLLPWPLRVAATWGGHEGSLLLWQLMLSGWTLAVAAFSRRLSPDMLARVLAVLGLVSIGFLSFTLFTSNPFDRALPAPPDGQDLNPLLQDPGMIFHPPLLYMGYVGLSVAFAFAIAALLSGRLDAEWARWSRPWTLAAWSFLTLGILLGSFWAYYELGWGGWWFWDAVENASFMPWLVATALLHSLAVSEQRGSFKSWTVLLAILAFSLSLLGTFLVRSGVLTSVHAFASDPRRGLYILAFLVVVIGGSLALYAWRAPRIGLGGRFDLLSRETGLLLNNVFLLVSAATILLGTLYPLALDAITGARISVGPPYFEAVFVPLMLPLLGLLALGPFVNWKRDTWDALWTRLRGAWPVWLAAAAVTLLAAGIWARLSAGVAGGLLLAVWIGVGTVHLVARRVQGVAARSWPRAVARIPAAWWGMVVAHLGVGVFVAGVTLARGLDHVQDASLQVGQAVQVGDYRFAFQELQRAQGPNYVAARATFEVSRDGQRLATLYPEKRLYVVQRMPMTEAAIDRGWTRDLYVSLADTGPDSAWGVRVQVKPFMSWVWAGVLVIAIGGLVSACDARYRRNRSRSFSERQGASEPLPQAGLRAPSPLVGHLKGGRV